MRKRARPIKKAGPPLVVLVDSGKQEYLDALAAAGYRVAGVSTAKEAIRYRPRPDAVLLELVVPGEEWSSLAKSSKGGRRSRAMSVVVLAREDQQEAIVKAGAAFCRFPCPPEELVEVVKRVLPFTKS